MSSATLSTKGQIVIPREVREAHRLVAGMRFEVETRGGCIVLRPIHEVPRTALEDLVGCTGYRGPRKTLEEMEEGIAEGAGTRS